jgi:hypothetical protein
MAWEKTHKAISEKQSKSKRPLGVAQVEELLPSRCRSTVFNPQCCQKNKKTLKKTVLKLMLNIHCNSLFHFCFGGTGV